MNIAQDGFVLYNSATIPCLGFGTWQIPDGTAAVGAVKEALRKGYRHIDAAAIYGNERSVGKGIVQSGVDREELFVTSKVWNSERGYEKTLAAFDKTLDDLQLEYLDMYLIHWPASPSQFNDWQTINLTTWEAMEELYKSGRVRAIGACNFMVHHLESLLQSDVRPMVNQIEYHPGQQQEETVEFCKRNKILIEAWSPLGSGKMLSNPMLSAMAEKYRKSVAQLCIKWCLQNGVLPLPKSVTPSRIAENLEVFDFAIAEEDMREINQMDYFGGSGLHPDQVPF